MHIISFNKNCEFDYRQNGANFDSYHLFEEGQEIEVECLEDNDDWMTFRYEDNLFCCIPLSCFEIIEFIED